MQIKSVRIENFRCFEKIKINFDKLTILIGENNIGKTALLTAIDKVLGFGRTAFEESDFYKAGKDDDPKKSVPILIEIELVPSNEAEDFSEDEKIVLPTYLGKAANLLEQCLTEDFKTIENKFKKENLLNA